LDGTGVEVREEGRGVGEAVGKEESATFWLPKIYRTVDASYSFIVLFTF